MRSPLDYRAIYQRQNDETRRNQREQRRAANNRRISLRRDRVTGLITRTQIAAGQSSAGGSSDNDSEMQREIDEILENI